jgi:hypothetical protein
MKKNAWRKRRKTENGDDVEEVVTIEKKEKEKDEKKIN